MALKRMGWAFFIFFYVCQYFLVCICDVSYSLIYAFVWSRHEPQLWWRNRGRKTWKGKSYLLNNGKKKRDCFRKNGTEKSRNESKLSRVSHTLGNQQPKFLQKHDQTHTDARAHSLVLSQHGGFKISLLLTQGCFNSTKSWARGNDQPHSSWESTSSDILCQRVN